MTSKRRGAIPQPPGTDDQRDAPPRTVQLPPEPSDALIRARSAAALRRRTPGGRSRVELDDESEALVARRSSSSTTPTRPSALRRLSRYSVELTGRTSMVEIAAAADRIAAVTGRRVPRRVAWRATVLAGAGALLVLLLSAAFAFERWRWLPSAFVFASVLVALGSAGMRALPRLARRFGERELPGHTGLWLTFGFGALAAGSWGITQQVSAAVTYAGSALTPKVREYLPALAPAPPPTELPAPRARDVASRLRRQIWVSPGLLFVPPSFEPTDGTFNLLLHFHGDPQLVRGSVEAAGLNALVWVTNLGPSSHDYQQPFAGPNALGALVAKIREKAGLERFEVGRIGLSSWSAGYGAPLVILGDSENARRIDALLLLDGAHSGFVPGEGRTVALTGIAPFVDFAKEAVAGRKLMWLTHSDIDTYEYSSSTESADAVLEAIGFERERVDGSDSPPPVELEAAVGAFPGRSPHWLQARSAAEKGDLHVAGYAGKGPEDHIAQLAQMSVTVLPALAKRWATSSAAASPSPPQ